MNSIIDLHCDLLGCINFNHGKYSFESPELNCSLPQLIEGNVKLQILAIWSDTEKGSTIQAKNQLKLYKELLQSYPEKVGQFREFRIDSRKTHFIFGIENASGFIEEDESLELLFERFERCQETEEILYVSFTWFHENRFGGGDRTKIGLKKDGKHLLDFLDNRGVAVDMSHTSDRLAYDILSYIDKKSLDIPVIASHSNFRSIHAVPRNLPDEIAKEIIRRKGVIGINFVQRIVGETPMCFIDHIKHALSLGGENAISLGADYYGGIDIDPDPAKPTFFSEFGNSGCYQKWTDFLRKEFSDEVIEKITFRNAEKYLKNRRAKISAG